MTKQEVIWILRDDEIRLVNQSHLKSMSEDGTEWKMYIPSLDWVESHVTVLDDGRVRITEWPHGLYGPRSERYMTYDEFMKPVPKEGLEPSRR